MMIEFKDSILRDAEYDPASGDHLRRDLPAGVAAWARDADGGVRSLLFTCPCGCKVVRSVPVSRERNPAKAWEWDGNEAAPTLRPSIWFQSGCCWHGFLTQGEWRKC